MTRNHSNNKTGTRQQSTANSTNTESQGSEQKKDIEIIIPCAIITFVSICVLFIILRCKKRRSPSHSLQLSDDKSIYLEFHELIGHGKFSKVYKGEYNKATVAIKVLKSARHSRWMNEKKILEEHNNHENITKLFASNIQQKNNEKSLLLIQEHVEGGTLRSFLKHETFDILKCLFLMKTLCFAVCYVHSGELTTGTGKHVTIHRDIKSVNVLISPAKGCVLADFGLAFLLKANEDVYKVERTKPVGTPRYMSPEKLLKQMAKQSIMSLIKTDVYAVGLVLYEIAKRCSFQCSTGNTYKPDDYSLPYHPLVGYQPSIQRMRRVVCFRNQRPRLPAIWKSNPVFSRIQAAIEESWNTNPKSRPSALDLYAKLECLERMTLNQYFHANQNSLK